MEFGICVIGIMKRILIVSIVSFLAVCSMAQEPSVLPVNQPLWVIDGLVMDTTTVTRGEIVTDSIEPWLERYFPLIKTDDIKEIRLLRASDEIQIYCVNPNVGIIVITTRKDSGLRDLELNGVYTTKRKRIGLAELSCKTYHLARPTLTTPLRRGGKSSTSSPSRFTPRERPSLTAKAAPTPCLSVSRRNNRVKVWLSCEFFCNFVV